jgi:hypothetical protein
MQPADRLHALDAVRAYALLLGVVLHGSAAFLVGFPMPMWLDTPSDGAPIIYFVIQKVPHVGVLPDRGVLLRACSSSGAASRHSSRSGWARRYVGSVLVVVGVTGALGLVLGAHRTASDFPMSLAGGATAAGAAPTHRPRLGGSTSAISGSFIPSDLLRVDARDSGLSARRRSAQRPRGRLRPRRRVLDAGVWGPVLIALPIAAYL